MPPKSIPITLCNSGLNINRANVFKIFSRQQYLKLLNDLTLRHQRKIGAPIIARCYKSTVQTLILPRTFTSYLIKNNLIARECIKNELSAGEPLKEAYGEFSKNLFPNQTVICQWLVDNIFTESRRKIGLAGCVLNLQAGLGKTFVAGGIINSLGRRTLYIVPRKHLKEQAEHDLNFNSEDVQFIIINTAIAKPDDFFKQFGLIIFDEIHMYCSAVFKEIFFKAQAANVLGLTATPDSRADKFDKFYKMAVGRVIVASELPNYEAAADQFTGRVRVVEYKGPPEFTKTTISPTTGLPIVHDMIKQLAKDSARNKMIVGLAKELQKKGYCIYIFAENRKHVSALRKQIVEGGQIKNEEVAELMGGSDASDEKYGKCSIIVLTYSYGGTGLSYIRMNAAIFATPRRSNYEQICRRITRKGGNETIERVYIDILDTACFLKHQFHSRKKVYEYFNYPISYESPPPSIV